MKFKTVREGQQAVVFNYLGVGRLITGPERVFLFRERLSYLKAFTADQYQYLVLKDIEGTVIHRRGPCEVFHNPMIYESIKVCDATKIDANHLIVVYKRLKDNDVQRRIIQGPMVFVPEAEEWLHVFKWHGAKPDDKTRMIPGYSTFSQLAVIPDQFYYNVRDVRTNDDTMITVKLMLFYEIKDILKMLDTTHDPIADMINAVCADVIAFSGAISFEDFLIQTSTLSDLATYKQLIQRAEKIGFHVQKVVFRGYHASEQLQAMQCSAIESRTQLRLNGEIQEQQQRLANLKLTKEQERTKLKQDMDRNSEEHKQRLADMKQSHELEIKQMEHEHKLKLDSLKTLSLIDVKTAKNEQEVSQLTKLKDLGVDLTKFLTNNEAPLVNEEVQVVSSHTDL